MTRPDGTPVNAVYGFTSMLMKLLADTDADHIAVVFDKARRTFRNDIYPDYKANRPDPPDELIPQFALVREAVQAFNVAAVDAEGFEADDLIATYARQARAAGAVVTIVSSDKDLMQLVTEGVVMFDAMRGRVIGPDEVREKFGVGPDKVVDVQALAGDSTDNVPGVPGIGVKTAALLIEEYGDLDTLLARASEIKQPKRRASLLEEAELARVSRDLVRLRDDVPVDTPLEAFAVKDPEPDALLGFLKAHGFKSLLAAGRKPPAGARRARGRAGAGASARERLRAGLDDRRAGRLGRRRARGGFGRGGHRDHVTGRPCAPSWWGCRWRWTAVARAISRSPTRGRRARARSSFRARRPNAPRPGRSRSPTRSRSSSRCSRIRPSSRWARTSSTTCTCLPAMACARRPWTTPWCCPSFSRVACTATAWTSSRAFISVARPSSSPRWPEPGNPR